ncbi:MAG: ATP-binding protein [Reyranella sp.]|nr:ATP-binding protein [Reyranella sp.]MDP3162770.1 ATP-binding protein [Reyranella sp.]
MTKENAGGSATASGMNFQAAVTAIANVCVLTGVPLGWLEGLIEDVPVSILTETGGAGDDIQLRYKDGSIAEVQIKRGLQAGPRLWEPLLKLSQAIRDGDIAYGILVVSPDSSRSIAPELAQDIRRMGDGRTDNLGALAERLSQELVRAGMSIQRTCEKLRIVTIHALHEDEISIQLARHRLTQICAKSDQVLPAWDRLYRDAAELIETRGLRSSSSILRILRSTGIGVKSSSAAIPGAALAKLVDWTLSSTESFSILGIKQPLSIEDAWIPLRALVRDRIDSNEYDLAEALRKYHNWSERDLPNDSKICDAFTIGRFFHHAVVVAGPGMGKSTLLAKIARCYASESYPVLRVKLQAVATRMKHKGDGFVESLFALGLDGSALGELAIQHDTFDNWVILCDGLDECGPEQEIICEGLVRFAAGHPNCRLVLTTRPIGYRSSLLKNWRHYDLLSLEEGDLPGHIATLLRNILPVSHPIYNDADEIARSQLKKRRSIKLATRSPLLLALTASLLSQGISLQQSKVQLYQKIFQLFEQMPNTRTSSSVSTAVLCRFLDVLAWTMLNHPLSQPQIVIHKCAKQLAKELGSSELTALVTAQTCMQHWQEIGILERIWNGADETVTFVHKSFGEFAAARHVASIPLDDQIDAVALALNSDDFAEVWQFGVGLGLANLILPMMLDRRETRDDAAKTVRDALFLAADVETVLEPNVVRRLVDNALFFVKSERRPLAHQVGAALAAVASRFPAEIGPRVAPLVHSMQPWTKLAAWACVVNAGKQFYVFNELKDTLSNLGALLGELASRLNSGFTLHSNRDNLAELLATGAAEQIFANCSAEEATELFATMVNTSFIGGLDFRERLSELIAESGVELDLKRVFPPSKTIWDRFFPEGYNAAQVQSHEAIFATFQTLTLGVRDRTADQIPCSPLLHLSAFLEATNFGHAPANDVWTWSEPFESDVVKEVVLGAARASSINIELLAQEVTAFLDELRSANPKQAASVLWQRTAHVDVPSIEWGRAKDLELDCAKLELALHHQSRWLVKVAVGLLSGATSAQALAEVTTRVLGSGRRYTLWAAVILASKLEKSLAVKIVCERLNEPLVEGCDYLFRLLAYLKPIPDCVLLPAIRNGLMRGDDSTAKSAADLLSEITNQSWAELEKLLHAAYAYWLENEKPYPEKSGAVPDSPRSKILSILCSKGAVKIDQMLPYLSDERPDVTEVAATELIKQLNTSHVAREQFIGWLEAESVSPNLLTKALSSKTIFNAAQVERLTHLLKSKNPRLRFAAINILDEAYLTESKLVVLAVEMTSDPEEDIRQAALKIIDH